MSQHLTYISGGYTYTYSLNSFEGKGTLRTVVRYTAATPTDNTTEALAAYANAPATYPGDAKLLKSALVTKPIGDSNHQLECTIVYEAECALKGMSIQFDSDQFNANEATLRVTATPATQAEFSTNAAAAYAAAPATYPGDSQYQKVGYASKTISCEKQEIYVIYRKKCDLIGQTYFFTEQSFESNAALRSEITGFTATQAGVTDAIEAAYAAAPATYPGDSTFIKHGVKGRTLSCDKIEVYVLYLKNCDARGFQYTFDSQSVGETAEVLYTIDSGSWDGTVSDAVTEVNAVYAAAPSTLPSNTAYKKRGFKAVSISCSKIEVIVIYSKECSVLVNYQTGSLLRDQKAEVVTINHSWDGTETGMATIVNTAYNSAPASFPGNAFAIKRTALGRSLGCGVAEVRVSYGRLDDNDGCTPGIGYLLEESVSFETVWSPFKWDAGQWKLNIANPTTPFKEEIDGNIYFYWQLGISKQIMPVGRLKIVIANNSGPSGVIDYVGSVNNNASAFGVTAFGSNTLRFMGASSVRKVMDCTNVKWQYSYLYDYRAGQHGDFSIQAEWSENGFPHRIIGYKGVWTVITRSGTAPVGDYSKHVHKSWKEYSFGWDGSSLVPTFS